MKPLKVMLLTYLFPEGVDTAIGGAARSVLHLARGLQQAGHQVVVVTTRPAPGLELSSVAGVRVYRFRPNNLYWIGHKQDHNHLLRALWQIVDFWNPHSLRVVRRLAAREQPDLIHAHKLRGLSPSVWAAGGTIPLVQTCQDYELISPDGTLSRWPSRGPGSGVVLAAYRRLRRLSSGAVRAITAPSAYTLPTIRAQGLFPGAIQRPVANSHGMTKRELDRAVEAPAPRPGEPTRFLYLGRLEPSKGLLLLRQVFDGLLAEGVRFRLDLAGWGSLQEEVLSWAERNASIYFHGPLNSGPLRSLMRAADVLLVPSIWPEAFGMVAVEAMAMGVPTLAARVGGLQQVVRSGETGVLLPAGNVQAWRGQIDAYCRDPGSARAMGPACLQAACDYTLEAVTEGYLGVYRQLLGSQHRRRTQSA